MSELESSLGYQTLVENICLYNKICFQNANKDNKDDNVVGNNDINFVYERLIILDVLHSIIQSKSSYYNIRNNDDWMFQTDQWRKIIKDYCTAKVTRIVLLFEYSLNDHLLENSYLNNCYQHHKNVHDELLSTYSFIELCRLISSVIHDLFLQPSSGSQIIIYPLIFLNNKSSYDINPLLFHERIIPTNEPIYIGKSGKLYPIYNDTIPVKEINPNMVLARQVINFPYEYEVILLVGQKGSGKKKLSKDLAINKNYVILNSGALNFKDQLYATCKRKINIVINGYHPNVTIRRKIISIIETFNIPIRIFWCTQIPKKIPDDTSGRDMQCMIYSSQFVIPTAYEGPYIVRIF